MPIDLAHDVLVRWFTEELRDVPAILHATGKEFQEHEVWCGNEGKLDAHGIRWRCPVENRALPGVPSEH